MQLTVFDTPEELGARVATYLIFRARHSTENWLLPTGGTPKPVYAELRKHAGTALENITTWNLDEYVVRDGARFALLDPEDEASYHHFMREQLLAHVPVAASHFPSVQDIVSPGNYDKRIAECGGINFGLLGLGLDGHFAFNFPGSSFESVTRMVRMNDVTSEANLQRTGYETPEYAVTAGHQTVMGARSMIVIVTGEEKAEILAEVMSSRTTEEIPATHLLRHHDCRWVVDKAAASLLRDNKYTIH